MKLVLTCDGACRRGIGGYAWVGQEHGVYTPILGDSGLLPERPTTNQRAELYAAIMALEGAHHWRRMPEIEAITVVSDSAYLVNCFLEEWHVWWTTHEWHTKDGKEVANQDLWERLVHLAGPLVQFVHVRGHAGHPMNELCDEAASARVEWALQ